MNLHRNFYFKNAMYYFCPKMDKTWIVSEMSVCLTCFYMNNLVAFCVKEPV